VRTLTDGVRHWVPQNRWDLIAPLPAPDQQPDLAIVVPYFEQPESLLRMYAALGVARLDPGRTEIVIVDDGSSAPPPSPPQALPFKLTILRQADLGCRPGAARNLAASHTRADVLVFLDSDTLPEPCTVARLAGWPASMPDALVVGRRGHVDLAGWSEHQIQDWLTGNGAPPPRRADPAWLTDGYRSSHDLLSADERSFRYVISAVMACHRSLFDDIGGFDDERSHYGGEDWEFAARAFTNGGVLVHDPEAVAWHDEPDWADREHGGETLRGAAGEPASGDKTEETLWLASHIPDPATRGLALRQRFADTIAVLQLPPSTSPARFLATIHTVLTELPDVSLHLPEHVPDLVTSHVRHDPRVRPCQPGDDVLRRARTVVTMRSAMEARPGALRALVASVGPGGLGRVDIVDDGRPAGRVESSRAAGRARRAATFGIDPVAAVDELFGRRTVEAAGVGLRALSDDLDLAAWLVDSAGTEQHFDD